MGYNYDDSITVDSVELEVVKLHLYPPNVIQDFMGRIINHEAFTFEKKFMLRRLFSAYVNNQITGAKFAKDVEKVCINVIKKGAPLSKFKDIEICASVVDLGRMGRRLTLCQRNYGSFRLSNAYYVGI